jgi:hypothetical protein
MDKLTIELHLNNDAYRLENGKIDYHAIQDQLILVAENIGDGNIEGTNIRDFNGNNSGQYFIESY